MVQMAAGGKDEGHPRSRVEQGAALWSRGRHSSGAPSRSTAQTQGPRTGTWPQSRAWEPVGLHGVTRKEKALYFPLYSPRG